MTASDNYERPKKQCDLVMKGGITSGIVYPPALNLLADDYTFNSIGGTSAGAIAAAGAAAAEYNRYHGGGKAGFEQFKLIGAELADAKKQTLLHLFDAPQEPRPRYVGAVRSSRFTIAANRSRPRLGRALPPWPQATSHRPCGRGELGAREFLAFFR